MFEKIDIGIKTFLRDECLFNAIAGIQKNYPGARMIIVDDGEHTEMKDGVYADLIRDGHIVDMLPFDSGFGRKSNRIVELYTRPYLLIGSDDFDFTKDSAEGLKELQAIFNFCESVDIASGRVNNRKYEFFLNICDRDGIRVKETEAFFPQNSIINPWYLDCDLTVNYSLVRRKVFEKVRWDDDVRIGGGEHGSFFYDCKLAGFRTVYVPFVNINEQQIRNSPRYKEYRNRAQCPDRPCFEKRGITEWILGDGRVDYRR